MYGMSIKARILGSPGARSYSSCGLPDVNDSYLYLGSLEILLTAESHLSCPQQKFPKLYFRIKMKAKSFKIRLCAYLF